MTGLVTRIGLGSLAGPVGTAFAVVKPFLPYVALALGLIAGYFAIYNHGKHVQAERDGKVITALRADLATEHGNVVTLRTSVDEQNASVLASAATAAKAQKASQDALGKALSADKAAAGLRAQAAALAHAGAAVCATPIGDQLSKSAWSKL